MISIGAPLPSSEPLGLLTDCHRRIEAALEVLASSSAWPDFLNDEQQKALSRALSFFVEMAPKHTADEESSLFPRLRALGETLPELAALESDHQTADHWHKEVDQLGRAWIENRVLEPSQRDTYNQRVTQLKELYRTHIAVEESIVFPLAKLRIPIATQEEVRREMIGRRAITLALFFLCLAGANLFAQAHLGSVAVQGSVRTRVESWDWFSNGQGDNQYAFSGTFARLSFLQSRKALDWQVEFAAAILLGLPNNAIAPGSAGALGLGANYFTANHRNSNNAFVFLKQGNLRFKNLGGDNRNSLKLGRFEFNDGTELNSKNLTLTALKRDRIAQRLIGNFGWTHVGRSLDGFHFVSNRKVAIHFLGALPTRGVFQVDGWGPLRTGFAYLSVNRAEGNTDWRLFSIYYHDWRHVLKTDNRPLALRRNDLANIRIGSYGGHLLHAIPTKSSGTVDLLLWGVGQQGRWGTLNHLAAAIATELGWQPPVAPKLKPWFRAGYFYGTGDGNPNDQRHGTFFQILPTPRPFARIPFFNLMNSEDIHTSVTIRSSKTVTLKSEFHALRLASGADQWLQGGGAFQPWTFGYVGRPSPVSSGRPTLANLYDLSCDWNLNPHATLSAYFGHAQGLRTIEAIYTASNHANFAYLDLSYRF